MNRLPKAELGPQLISPMEDPERKKKTMHLQTSIQEVVGKVTLSHAARGKDLTKNDPTTIKTQ